MTAAEALGKIVNPEAVSALIAALNHSDNFVRSRAAEALVKIGNPEGVSALIAALNHSDWDVRMTAAEALGKIDDSEILKQLIRNWTINIYEPDIFLLARKLAVRYSQ
ncbi:MAG: HEAT repeat domain-containing protein [Xenococcaceae cyanobacterium]